jgi:hypothetical protein
MLGSSRVAAQLAASQEGLSSMSDVHFIVFQHPVALISIISSIYISNTLQHKIGMVTLIFVHNMFWPYMEIIMCARYAELFIALLVSILKLK